MSETLATKSPEQQGEALKTNLEIPKVEYSKSEQAENVSKAETAVLEASASASEKPTVVDTPVNDGRPMFIDNAIKSLRLKQNLNHVQSKLKPGNKVLSKVVHQPLVRIVSDSAANTVTRPSGLLGGGIMAFVGSLIYLFLAHHIGFRYNYLLFLILFVGGFLVGLAGELIVHRLQRIQSKA